MSKYRIYRNPKGISLNRKEFICDDSGHVRLFESEGLAMFWIKKQSSHSLEAKTPEELFINYGIGIELNDTKQNKE